MEERQRRSYRVHNEPCPICGRPMHAAKSNAKTCSPRCRQSLSRMNRATAAAAVAAAAVKKRKKQKRRR